MDINLTGQIAGQIAENLVQNPLMTVGAGAIGGVTTGLFAILAVIIT